MLTNLVDQFLHSLKQCFIESPPLDFYTMYAIHYCELLIRMTQPCLHRPTPSGSRNNLKVSFESVTGFEIRRFDSLLI